MSKVWLGQNVKFSFSVHISQKWWRISKVCDENKSLVCESIDFLSWYNQDTCQTLVFGECWQGLDIWQLSKCQNPFYVDMYMYCQPESFELKSETAINQLGYWPNTFPYSVRCVRIFGVQEGVVWLVKSGFLGRHKWRMGSGRTGHLAMWQVEGQWINNVQAFYHSYTQFCEGIPMVTFKFRLV